MAAARLKCHQGERVRAIEPCPSSTEQRCPPARRSLPDGNGSAPCRRGGIRPAGCAPPPPARTPRGQFAHFFWRCLQPARQGPRGTGRDINGAQGHVENPTARPNSHMKPSGPHAGWSTAWYSRLSVRICRLSGRVRCGDDPPDARRTAPLAVEVIMCRGEPPQPVGLGKHLRPQFGSHLVIPPPVIPAPPPACSSSGDSSACPLAVAGECGGPRRRVPCHQPFLRSVGPNQR